jgi:Zn-dependent membrane protease YugP
MIFIVGIIVILVVMLGPGVWVRRVLERYSVPADRYSGTGGQLARHLLDKHGLQAVKVEASEQGDHYDPEAKTVRLTPDKFAGRSLTAITVAAHEVGHALQDHESYRPLHLRTRLVKATRGIEKLGAGVNDVCCRHADARDGSHSTFHYASDRIQRQFWASATDA